MSTVSRRYLFYVTEQYAYPILRPLQRAIEAIGGELAWFIHGATGLGDGLEPSDQRLEAVADVIDYCPDAVLTPANVVPHFFPGVKVQLFHGFNARKRSRGKLDSHFALRGFFDLYCTQGPSTTSCSNTLVVLGP